MRRILTLQFAYLLKLNGKSSRKISGVILSPSGARLIFHTAL